jgi:DNA-binding NarL/FixJ family response regulator
MGSATDTEIFSKNEWDVLVNELSLSPRQAEVIQNLFSGFSDKQISRELKIAVPTVRTHLTRLFSRFDLQDRNELILHVIRHFRNKCRTNGNGCPRWLSHHDE